MRNKPNQALIALRKMFKQEGKKVLVYPAKEVIADHYEQNKEKTFYNPIPVQAIVRDFSSEALAWREAGLKNIGAKTLIVEKACLPLFKNINKLMIDGEEYCVFKDAVSRRAQLWERAGFALIIAEKV